MGLIRLLFFILALAVIYFLVRKFFPASDYKKCDKCEGKGYWVALRGRESCDVCSGSGKVSRNNG